MIHRYGIQILEASSKHCRLQQFIIQHAQRRFQHTRRRPCLSQIWIPKTITKAELADHGKLDFHEQLLKGGFVEQAYSGIFHVLPLGLRVQEKLEKLIEKHMQSIGASKVSLSSLSRQELWQRSGRLQNHTELFTFKDRKSVKWLLAPTHEEEITTLVAGRVTSYRDLPIRLYQITRKYRDERRPRQGLLRGREFLMKDLYTFDADEQTALETYEEVRQAYHGMLTELNIPFLTGDADSGNMGGHISHEYHIVSPLGEDDVVHCPSCFYTSNTEVVPKVASKVVTLDQIIKPSTVRSRDEVPVKALTTYATTADAQRLVVASTIREPSNEDGPSPGLNSFALKAIVPDIDTGISSDGSLERYLKATAGGVMSEICYIFDYRLDASSIAYKVSEQQKFFASECKRDLSNVLQTVITLVDPDTDQFDLLPTRTGSSCPKCKTGKVEVHKTIEVGHTFHLGTRYSDKLGLQIMTKGTATDPNPGSVSVQMGCHGIGVSRMIAAVAAACKTDTQLMSWPRAISPYHVAVVPLKPKKIDPSAWDLRATLADEIYDRLAQPDSIEEAIGHPLDLIDAIIDDRVENVLSPHHLGIPISVFIDSESAEDGSLLVECTRLGVKERCAPDEVRSKIKDLLARL